MGSEDGDAVRRLSAGPDVTGEYEEKRSRFLGVLRRVDGEDEARQFVAELRREFPDARHHCSAFLVDVPGANPVERSNDDGEPAGTAGTPMLDVLRGSGLSGVACVVVRWFGGTKLGTGGLVRAYGAAVRAALAEADAGRRVVRVIRTPAWTVGVDHAVAGKLESELRAAGVEVLGVDYGSAVTVRVAAEDSVISPILAAVTSGDAEWVRSGTALREEIVEN